MDKTKKEITKYENKFNDLSLADFNITQRRILMALLTRSRDVGLDQKIHLTKQDLIDLHVYLPETHVTRKEFEKDLRQTLKSCQSLHFHNVMRHGNYNRLELIPLFIRICCDFTDDLSDVNLEFELNPYFVPLLKDVFKNYTTFPLLEYQSLRSIYSQTLYRCLKQYDSTGKWTVSRDELLAILEVPKSYIQREDALDLRVFHPAMKELRPLFPGLELRKIRDKGRPRGRGRIVRYEFTWNPRTQRSSSIQKSRPEITNPPAPTPGSSKKSKFYLPQNGDLPSGDELLSFQKQENLPLSLGEMRAILSRALDRGPVSSWQKYLKGAAAKKQDEQPAKKRALPDWYYDQDDNSGNEELKKEVEALWAEFAQKKD